MVRKELIIDQGYIGTKCVPNAAVVFGYQLSPEVYNKVSPAVRRILERKGLKHNYRPKTELLQDEGGEMVWVDPNPSVILGVEVLSTRDATSINDKTLEKRLKGALEKIDGMKGIIAKYPNSLRKDPRIYLLAQSTDDRDYRFLTN